MRVSEDVLPQKRKVPGDERRGGKIARGVVEVHVPELVEQRIVTRTQIIERACGAVGGIGREKTGG